jgi:hypothetical protein
VAAVAVGRWQQLLALLPEEEGAMWASVGPERPTCLVAAGLTTEQNNGCN